MLFDNFCLEEFEEKSVYDEIISNISDILDSCNHVNGNTLPYSFGSNDITNITTDTLKSAEKDLQNKIEAFEPRLSSVNASFLSVKNNIITVEISGAYTNDNGERLRMSFTKAIYAD